MFYRLVGPFIIQVEHPNAPKFEDFEYCPAITSRKFHTDPM
jgi:hypothetical protein